MNKIYRTIWNEATQSWVAVSELAKSHKKSSSGIIGAVVNIIKGVRFTFSLIASALLIMTGQVSAVTGLDYPGTDNQTTTDNLCFFDVTSQSVVCGSANTKTEDTAGGKPAKSVVIGLDSTNTGESNVTIGAGAQTVSGHSLKVTTVTDTATGAVKSTKTEYAPLNTPESSTSTVDPAAGTTTTVVVAKNITSAAIAIGQSAKSTGGYGTAIGYEAEAARAWDISIGRYAGAGQTTTQTEGRNIAIGDGALKQAVNPNNNIALGTDAGNSMTGMANVVLGTYANSPTAGSGKITANDTVAIGNRAVTTTSSSIAIGSRVKASGNIAVAIGTSAHASGNYAIAQGYATQASGTSSIAIGGAQNVPNQTRATGNYSTALGFAANAGAEGAIAIGRHANHDPLAQNATNPNNTTSADKARTTGVNSVAIGTDTNSAVHHSIAIGTNAKTVIPAGANAADIAGAIAIGRNSNAEGQGSTAMGINARSSGQSIAIGTNANNTGGTAQPIGASTVAIGNNANAQSARSIAFGNDARAGLASAGTGVTAALAIGSASVAEGQGSVVIGDSAKNDRATTNTSHPAADQAVAIGVSSNVNSLGGMALGSTAKTTGVYGTAIGIGTVNQTDFGVALGALSSTDKNITVNRTGYLGDNYTDVAATVANAAGVSVGGEILNKQGSSPGQTAVRPAGVSDNQIIRRQIHNVAAGTDNTDAVNVSQLKALSSALDASKTHFYSVKSADTGAGNFNNDGAKSANALAAGVNAFAQGTSAVAIGDSANANATMGSIAIGSSYSGVDRSTGQTVADEEVKAWSDNAIAIGVGAEAGLDKTNPQQVNAGKTGAIAIGTRALAYEISSVALGEQSNAFGTNSLALGANSTTNNNSGVAIGDRATSEGVNTVALGANTKADGTSAVAIGDLAETKTAAYASVALGNKALVTAAQGVASGFNAQATVADSVALGSNSKADRSALTVVDTAGAVSNPTVAGNTVYALNVASSADKKAITDTVKGNAGAVSVGGAYSYVDSQGQTITGTNTRQIINVAAGTEDSDAVNVAQLKAVANSVEDAWLQGVGNTSSLGGGATYNPATNTYTAPTYTVKDAAGNPVTYTNAAGNTAVTTANNVGDVVTQLNTYINRGWDVADNQGATKGTVTPGEKVQFVNGTGTTSSVQTETNNTTKVSFNVETTTLSTSNGKVNAADAGTKFATAKSVADAINAAGFTLTTAAATGTNGETTTPAVKSVINAGDTVTVEAAKNISVSQADGKVTVATKDAVEFTQVKLGNATNNTTLTSTANGLDVGNDKITNVAAGNIAAGSTDAVNGGQLHDVKATAESKLGEFTVGADKNATATGITVNKDNTRFDVVGTTDGKVETAVDGRTIKVGLTADAKTSLGKADTALQSIKVKANGTDVKDLTQTDNVLNITQGNNITVAKDGTGDVKVSLNDNINVTGVKATTVTAGTGANQVVLGNDGVKVGGNTYITNDGLNANNKVIKNVADGVQNSDAVNLGQLNNKATELVNTGIKVNADNNQVKTHKLGNELAIVAGNTTDATSTANLRTDVAQDATGKTTVTVKMKESPNFTAVTAGGTKIASDGLSFVDNAGAAILNSPKVSKTGIDAGGQKITNVQAGSDNLDAVNFAQLKAVQDAVKVAQGSAWELQGNGAKVSTVGAGAKVNFANGNGTTASVTETGGVSTVTYSVKTSVLATDPSNTGKVVVPTVTDTFATAKSVADAINAAGFTLTTAAATGTNGETTTPAVKSVINAGDTVTVEAAKNISVSQADGKVTVATKDAVEFTQVKLGNATNNTTLTSTANGLDVGNDKITNVAAGNIAAGSTDAVNGGQLHDVKTTAESKLGEFTVGADKNAAATGITVNKDNTRFDVVGATDGKVETTVDGRTIKVGLTADAKTSLGKADTALQNVQVAVGETNLTANKSGDTVTLDFSETPTFTGVTSGTVTAGSGANQVVLDNAGVKVGGATYISGAGLNANNQKVTNVANGVLDSDAVNLGQLNNKATELVNTGIKVNADNNQVKTHKLGNELAIVAGNTTDATSTANLRTDVVQDATGKTTVTVKMKESPNFTAVTAGGTKIASDGLSFVDSTGAAVANSPKVSATGIDAGNQKIANVANGTLDTDAVNLSQLKAVQTSAGVKTEVTQGDGVTVTDNSATAGKPSYEVSLNATTKASLAKADSAVQTIKVQANGVDAKTLTKDDNVLNITQGKNVTVAKDGTGDVKVSLNDDINVASVTAGNSKLDTNGLTITGGPSVTTAGINAGNKQITNVAAGKTATDAVNVSQLSPLATALGTTVDAAGSVTAPTFTVKKTDGTSNTPVATVQGALDQIGTELQKPITFTGNSGKTDRTLGQELVVSGGLTSGTSSNTNVKTVVTAGKVDIQLADAPTFAGQVKANGFDANGQKITNVANGVNAGDAVNKGQLDNIGWNIKANGGTVVDVVKNTDTVNFVNGTGTTAAVTTDPATNTTSVKYSVNKSTLTSTDGKATAGTAGDAFATATDVANAINAAGFTLTTAATANGQVSGSSNELINAGDKVTVEADKNIKVTQAAGTVTVATKDEVNFTKVTIGNTAGNNTVLTSTADGLDVGGDKIANVAAGTKDTDAVNLKQLKDVQTSAGVKTVVSEGDGVKVTNKGTATAPNYEVALNQATKDSLAKADSAVQTIKVQANGAAVKDLTQADNVLNITQGDNVTVAKDGSNVKVSLNKNIAVDSVTVGTGANQVVLNNSGVNVGGKTYITGAGVNANSQKVTNVANGTVAANSKDAVNGGQLFAQGSGVQNIIGGTTTYNPTTGTYTNNNIGGTGKGTIHDAIEAVNTVAGKGWNLTAQGANSSNVAAGETVDLRNSDGNIVVSKPATTDAVTFNLAKNLNVDSVKTGNTTVNNGGVTIANTDPTKTVSLTSGGLNNGGNRVTNIADGVDAKDAVNVSQLNAVKAQASVKTKVSAGDGVTVTNKGSATAPDYEVALNKATKDSLAKADSAVQTIKVQANGTAVKDLTQADNVLNITQGDNVTVSKDGGNVKVSLNKDINVNSVKAGDSTLTTNGLSINGGPSVTKAGIDAADKKLTNVAAGTVSNTSKDAINGSQLFAQGEGVKNIIGGTTTYDPATGTYTNNNIGGTGASNINDAIQTVHNAASAGWNLSAQGANKTNVAPNATVDLNNTDGNIVISKTTANNDVTFNLAKDLNVDTVKANSFTAGNTTINNGGLTIANTDPTKVVSLTSGGLNNGGNKVVNVAAGTADTDAANVGQLKGATTALGGGAGINADGTFKAPTYVTTTTAGTTLTANNVGDALTNLNNEVVKPLSFAADVGTNVERKLGSTVSVNGDSKNITTSTTANGVKVELNNTINVSGVVADGVSIKGNGPTLTKNGMNMAGQAITNMANGLPTKIDANGNVVPMTTVDIKQAIIDGTLDASVLNNAVNVGDLVEQGNNVLNVSKNIYGKDKDENPYVRADGTISSAGRAALRTYNVDDNGTLEHNGIFDAIKNMNEQGIKFFHTNDGVVNSPKDGYSEEDSNANAAYSTAIGYKALVSKNAVAGLAIGPASLADGAYSVALGAESVARDAHVAAGTTDSAYTYGGLNDNNVAAKATKATRVASIGAEGKERQLQHVAAGVISPTSTDAVNGSQLYYTNKAVENNTRAINQLRGDVHKMDRNLRAGVAGAYAAASLGQVYLPGKTQVSLGTGHYRGESAVALGISRVSDNGKVQVRLLGSTNSRGDTGAGASVSYLW